MVHYTVVLERHNEDEDENIVSTVFINFFDMDDNEQIASFMINTSPDSTIQKMYDKIHYLNHAISDNVDHRCTFKECNGLIEIEVKNGRVIFTVSNYEGCVMGDISFRFKLNQSLISALLELGDILKTNIKYMDNAN